MKTSKTVEYRVDTLLSGYRTQEWVIEDTGFTTLDLALSIMDKYRESGKTARVIRITSTLETMAMGEPTGERK